MNTKKKSINKFILFWLKICSINFLIHKKKKIKKEENEIKTRRKLLAFVGCFCFVLCLFGIQIENTMHEWPIYFAIALGYFENSSQPLSVCYILNWTKHIIINMKYVLLCVFVCIF